MTDLQAQQQRSKEAVLKSRKRRLDLLEAGLVEALSRQIKADHANRERMGCPGTSALQKLAVNAQSLECDYILVHLGYCAACLSELTQLRRNRITLRSTG